MTAPYQFIPAGAVVLLDDEFVGAHTYLSDDTAAIARYADGGDILRVIAEHCCIEEVLAAVAAVGEEAAFPTSHSHFVAELECLLRLIEEAPVELEIAAAEDIVIIGVGLGEGVAAVLLLHILHAPEVDEVACIALSPAREHTRLGVGEALRGAVAVDHNAVRTADIGVFPVDLERDVDNAVPLRRAVLDEDIA